MRTLLLPLLLAAAGCATAGTRTRGTVPAAERTLRGEEFRVVGSTATRDGDAFDAQLLFDRAIAHMRAQRCADALPVLDQLLRQFPASAVVPLAQYNRGLCLQRAQQFAPAADAMREAARSSENELAHDALLRVAALGEAAQTPAWVIEGTDALAARAIPLTITERVEVAARRASARLAQGDLDAADRESTAAIALAPTEEAVRALDDDTHAAEARVVAAEITRRRAGEVRYEVGSAEAEGAIVRRVQLVMHAHVQFNEAIRAGNPDWAAAAGFRIGEMYRDLYDSIVGAPVPAAWDDRQREIYRTRTAERLRPLLQGALRSWESTLVMARRTGITGNTWVQRAGEAVERLRAAVAAGP